MKLYRSRYLLPIAAPPLSDGALLVVGDRIAAVGPYRDLAAAHPGAAAIAFDEAVILPPFVNAHTHLELTDFPEWAAAEPMGEGGDFAEWILQLVRVRRSIADDAVVTSLRRGLLQCLQAGTGAIGDILTTLSVASAYSGTPLRGRVFAEVLGVDSLQVASRLGQIAAQLAAPPAVALQWGLSPHAPYTLSRTTFADACVFARDQELPIAMHWAETLEERDFLVHGRGPLAEKLYPMAGWPIPAAPPLPCDLASLPADSLLIHGVQVDQEDIEAVAASGQGVVLCPRSNNRFGAARAPLAAYCRAGVPLSLGTDSLASSPSLSIWDELAFARSWFADELTPAEWLAIATQGGAAALGLTQQMGNLTAGLEASFQVVALPDGATAATLEESLVAGGETIDVRTLYLAGEEIFRSTM